MSSVNKDQIWAKSELRNGYEYQVDRELSELFPKYETHLIDLVADTASDYVITDSILHHQEYVSVIPEFWGQLYHYQSEYKNCLPDKTFNCFINRTDSFRQSWFYQLVRRGLIDDGYISFNAHDRYSDRSPVETYDYYFTQGLGIFKEEHQAMRSQIPYNNLLSDIDQTIVNSKISLVIETYFAEDYGIAFSEKTFRVLQLPRPFILFGHTGAISVLRDTGFDLYEDIVDHSYDTLINNIQKQDFLLDTLTKFKELEYTADTLIEFEKRADHNRQVLLDLKNKWPTRYKQIKETLANK